jgi:ribonuclease P/MRP protein subunit POP5
VLPRVIAVSGTIKKLQSAAIVYHRKVTATAIAGLLLEGELQLAGQGN